MFAHMTQGTRRDGTVQVISRSAAAFIFPLTALLPAGESLLHDYRFRFSGFSVFTSLSELLQL